jgi:hypothetical protein
MYYKQKYLKYRMKYLALKKQMGGAYFQTIYNNGGIEGERMAQQCIWISIKDYLLYHLGITRTVRELKELVGLGPETDYTEFDDNKPELLAPLTRLCKHWGITLIFILVNRDGTVHRSCLDDNNNMVGTSINPGHDIVYIASFGGHFELITRSDNYVLPQYQTPTTALVSPTRYKPKVLVGSEYVPIASSAISQLQSALVEIEQNIEFYNKDIKIITAEMEQTRKAINSLSSLGLEPAELEQLTTIYKENGQASSKLFKILVMKRAALQKEKEALVESIIPKKEKVVEAQTNFLTIYTTGFAELQNNCPDILAAFMDNIRNTCIAGGYTPYFIHYDSHFPSGKFTAFESYHKTNLTLDIIRKQIENKSNVLLIDLAHIIQYRTSNLVIDKFFVPNDGQYSVTSPKVNINSFYPGYLCNGATIDFARNFHFFIIVRGKEIITFIDRGHNKNPKLRIVGRHAGADRFVFYDFNQDQLDRYISVNVSNYYDARTLNAIFWGN